MEPSEDESSRGHFFEAASRQQDDQLMPPLRWDILLSKYVGVWIWSVLLSASLVIANGLRSAADIRGWGPFTVVLFIPLAVSACSVVLCWKRLVDYLRGYLLPRFFFPGVDSDPERLLDLSHDGARQLSNASNHMFLAAAGWILAVLIRGAIYTIS